MWMGGPVGEGKVSSKYFDKGSSYKAGKQILLIDPEDKVAKLKEMEALLNQRKKELYRFNDVRYT